MDYLAKLFKTYNKGNHEDRSSSNDRLNSRVDNILKRLKENDPKVRQIINDRSRSSSSKNSYKSLSNSPIIYDKSRSSSSKKSYKSLSNSPIVYDKKLINDCNLWKIIKAKYQHLDKQCENVPSKYESPKKVKEPKVKKVKEVKEPKVKKVKEVKEPKVKKVKEVKDAKEPKVKKVKEVKEPKVKKVKEAEPKVKKDKKTKEAEPKVKKVKEVNKK